MADASTDETTGRGTARPSGSWAAAALAVVGWCLVLVASFVGMGEPRPGPDYEHALAHKAALARGLFGLALLAAAAAVVSGLRARARGRRGGLIGAFVGGALLVATLLWWLVAR
jgi:hypothetical protein